MKKLYLTIICLFSSVIYAAPTTFAPQSVTCTVIPSHINCTWDTSGIGNYMVQNTAQAAVTGTYKLASLSTRSVNEPTRNPPMSVTPTEFKYEFVNSDGSLNPNIVVNFQVELSFNNRDEVKADTNLADKQGWQLQLDKFYGDYFTCDATQHPCGMMGMIDTNTLTSYDNQLSLVNQTNYTISVYPVYQQITKDNQTAWQSSAYASSRISTSGNPVTILYTDQSAEGNYYLRLHLDAICPAGSQQDGLLAASRDNTSSGVGLIPGNLSCGDKTYKLMPASIACVAEPMNCTYNIVPTNS